MLFLKKSKSITGVEEIAAFVKCDVFKIMYLVRYYGLPAKKNKNAVWEADKLILKKWIKTHSALVEPVPPVMIQQPRPKLINKKTKRW